MLNKSLAAIGLPGLLALAGTAQAVTVSGNYNGHGYDYFTINVASAGLVDFTATSGGTDPDILLFDADGHHLITNEDSNGLLFHLTRNLGAGTYSVIVSTCCSWYTYLFDTGATYSNSDGYNLGDYYLYGSGTLAGMVNYLAVHGNAAGANATYSMEVANASRVPEPASFALAGMALLGLAISRRKA